MTERYMIHKHPNVITATEVKAMGSAGVVEQVLRFQSLDELVAHFSAQGVSANALDVVRRSVDSTGMAMLAVFKSSTQS